MITETTDTIDENTFGQSVRPLFLAHWSSALFIHYATDPAILQPYIPFDLHVRDGRAFVSLVAFTQRNLRPARGGWAAALLARPLSRHPFLNLRTYVMVDGEPGVYFIAEWIPNRLAKWLGPRMYGLPYRLGKLRYEDDLTTHETRREVISPVGRFAFSATPVSQETIAPATIGSLDAFLLERYSAYTFHDGIARRFRIAHAPWPQRRAEATIEDDSLLRAGNAWFGQCQLIGANHSDGVDDVTIGAPTRLDLPHPAAESGGAILYDGACDVCSTGATRASRFLERRGFRLLPLQSAEAHQLNAATPEALMTELHLVTPHGQVLRGVDALLHIASAAWWMRPLCWLARVPGMKLAMRRGYRYFAQNRYRFSAACRLRTIDVAPHPRPEWSLARWLPPILVVVAALVFTTHLPAWIAMWAIAIVMFGGCKWLTWWPSRRVGSIAKSLGYLLAWPGMDADTFFRAAPPPKPDHREAVGAIVKILIGASLFWGIARCFMPDHPMLAGWVGMTGLAMLVHFGALHLFALAWQRVGVMAEPLMRRPGSATSLADFWGRRWNTGFRVLSYDFVFRPLRRRLGVLGAAAMTFFLSGVIHDVVISVPARAGYGLPTLYFMMQFAGLLLERTRALRRLFTNHPAIGHLYALAFTILPVPILFHPPFVHRVMIPFMSAVGGFAHVGTMPSLKTLLIIAGLLHLAITSAGIVMTLVLDWRRNLAPLCALTRHVIWTHASFVLLTIIGFGVVSIACAGRLRSGDALARAVCGFIALFWLIRLAVQFFLFDARPFLTNLPLKLGYYGLTVVFTYFAFTYSFAALWPR